MLPTNEFVTLLPNSGLAAVEAILENLINDFQEHGIRQIQAGAYKSAASMEKVEFAIRAGLAQGPQGPSTVELDSIIALAKRDQKEIARIRCDARGRPN